MTRRMLLAALAQLDRRTLLDAAEVTNREFARFTSERREWSRAGIDAKLHNGDYLKHWPDGRCPEEWLDHPVTYVSWYACEAYAKWAGKRLPSEGGGWKRLRVDYPTPAILGATPEPTPYLANYQASGIGTTCRVKAYPPNGYGLHDLAGNVWEYCSDVWDGDAARRVIRGGSYGAAPVNMQLRWRDSHLAIGAGPHVGFRCARVRVGCSPVD
ncbi:MAG: SUMF1/EgtB/PvdO family nonheme iron enzyme [Bryobacterales bacterium]|nr:SUMF1/EgtB/PvdO family nonheme iron enzyme [Bryobacterales bacterium]